MSNVCDLPRDLRSPSRPRRSDVESVYNLGVSRSINGGGQKWIGMQRLPDKEENENWNQSTFLATKISAEFAPTIWTIIKR
jgi:hypothetical protein